MIEANISRWLTSVIPATATSAATIGEQLGSNSPLASSPEPIDPAFEQREDIDAPLEYVSPAMVAFRQ
jgi:hypothetical protein